MLLLLHLVEIDQVDPITIRGATLAIPYQDTMEGKIIEHYKLCQDLLLCHQTCCNAMQESLFFVLPYGHGYYLISNSWWPLTINY